MKQALGHLFGDLLSTIVFLVLYAVTGSIVFTTVTAIVVGVAEIVWFKLRGKPVDAMQWLSLGLVIVFGGLAFYTHNGRFIMAKPSIIHFAIGVVMLKRGWMDRYLPAIAHEALPRAVVVGAGYAWAAMMFALGIGNLIVAATCDRETWALYVTVVPLAAKFAAFGLQYLIFRTIIVRRIRGVRQPAAAVA